MQYNEKDKILKEQLLEDVAKRSDERVKQMRFASCSPEEHPYIRAAMVSVGFIESPNMEAVACEVYEEELESRGLSMPHTPPASRGSRNR